MEKLQNGNDQKRQQPGYGLKLVALASIAVATGVTGFKFAAYWLTGSAALCSDSLESIAAAAASRA